MADIPISQLPPTTGVDSEDEFAINQGGTTKKVEFSKFKPKDIPELASAGAIKDEDLIAVNQGGTTKKTTVGNILGGLSDVESDVSDIQQAIDKTVEQNTTYTADASTVNAKIDKVNLKTGATSSENKAFPVASSTQAGVINTATYDTIQNNAELIDNILNGSVAIDGLPADPTQQQLTQAWKDETGKASLVNHASIYDEDNEKIWTWYENVSEWKSIDASTQVEIAQATNTTLGIVKGNASTPGRIFVESNGEQSVNGWDDSQNAIKKNKDDIAALTTEVGKKQDTLVSGSNLKTVEGQSLLGSGNVKVLPDNLTYHEPDPNNKKGNIFPVGAVYISVTPTDPATWFGGTWVQFGQGQTLVGVNTADADFSPAMKTGGEKKHTLTVDEMPSHGHHPVGYLSAAPADNSGNHFNLTQSKSANWDASDDSIRNTGGSQPHNNLQPYVTVYFWRRTA